MVLYSEFFKNAFFLNLIRIFHEKHRVDLHVFILLIFIRKQQIPKHAKRIVVFHSKMHFLRPTIVKNQYFCAQTTINALPKDARNTLQNPNAPKTICFALRKHHNLRPLTPLSKIT